LAPQHPSPPHRTATVLNPFPWIRCFQRGTGRPSRSSARYCSQHPHAIPGGEPYVVLSEGAIYRYLFFFLFPFLFLKHPKETAKTFFGPCKRRLVRQLVPSRAQHYLGGNCLPSETTDPPIATGPGVVFLKAGLNDRDGASVCWRHIPHAFILEYMPSRLQSKEELVFDFLDSQDLLSADIDVFEAPVATFALTFPLLFCLASEQWLTGPKPAQPPPISHFCQGMPWFEIRPASPGKIFPFFSHDPPIKKIPPNAISPKIPASRDFATRLLSKPVFLRVPKPISASVCAAPLQLPTECHHRF